MMRPDLRLLLQPTFALCSALALAVLLLAPASALSQDRGSPEGEWHFQSGDAWGTRFSPADQIDASNFEDLEVGWIWKADNFGPNVDTQFKSTPSYIDGILYTLAGLRRTVAAIDPATGETLWTYREPFTQRWERSMRKNYGKGVAYGEVNGRGVIYYISPAFFLHALDAKSGQHLENFGRRVPIDGFPTTGVVDLLADLDKPYDVEYGVDKDVGYITSSSPPIVVNGVVVVGNSSEQGYNQTRRENVAGDILAYDARTGEHMWKFNVIPRPGEFGHETWENDAWSYTGNVASWAPMSADLERGIVYIPTDGHTNDYYKGYAPGDNLFATTLLALDVQTGERVWHFQTVHHDIWNYDNPNVPIVMDITVDGRQIPAVSQPTKQGFLYTFNRETGEPVWPIEERPVPQTKIPGEQTSPTQPFPTRPVAYELQGVSEDDLIDFTPELRRQALEMISRFEIGPLFNPPLHRDNPDGKIAALNCPSSAVNITHPTSLDPETGIMYVSSLRGCNSRTLWPGHEIDDPENPFNTGVTVMDWVSGPRSGFSGPQGLPIWKPPYSKITAIDMNTGEHLWWVPNGDTPEAIKNHPALRGVDLPNTGQTRAAVTLVTRSLLITTEGPTGRPVLHALDKKTGERLGTVQLPGAGQYGMMTYMHEGWQYIAVQTGASGEMSGSGLVVLSLPGAASQAEVHD